MNGASASRGWAANVLVCVMLSVWSGCASEDGSECSRDSQCRAGSVCYQRTCLARIASGSERRSLEVSPRLDSPYAVREIPELALGPDPVELAVDRKAEMVARIGRQPYEPGDLPSSIHLLLTVPSEIPGRRPQQFEGDGVSAGAGLPYEARVTVPRARVGDAARMTVVPIAPLDRWACPWMLDVEIAESSAVALPGTGETLTLEGRVDAPAPTGPEPLTYEARLFVGDRLVSNTARTDAEGKLLLRVQRSVAQQAAEMRLELGPVDRSQAFTTVTARIAAGQTNLPALRIPPFPAPVTFVIPIVGGDGSARVAGAAVRFTTVLESEPNGETRYTRVAQTDVEGNATIALIPGSTGQTRDYVVTVVPPPSSELGVLCLPTYSIGSVVTDTQRVGAVIALPGRAFARGRLQRAGGAPAPMVRVRATRQGDLFRTACGGDLASAPAETVTDAGGRYQLRLDPGDYRMEYFPPAGSPLAMFTEPRVSTGEMADRAVTLPEAVVVEGRVVGPGGEAVGEVELRAFGKGSGADLEIEGVGRSGPDGLFRLLLPRRF